MRISVIIPTWCEATSIASCVRSAQAVGDEVIVVDGGSGDGTRERASEAGACVLHTAKGRGAQLKEGAAQATGEVLLFLHADSYLPPEARPAILKALADPAVPGGNFRLVFDAQSLLARTFEGLYDLQRRILRHYYGDSAIFVRRSVYHELGGFEAFPLFEDYHFVKRMERHGRGAYLRQIPVRTSARRFQHKPWQAVLSWGALQVGYSLGASPERLAALYQDIRELSEPDRTPR